MTEWFILTQPERRIESVDDSKRAVVQWISEPTDLPQRTSAADCNRGSGGTLNLRHANCSRYQTAYFVVVVVVVVAVAVGAAVSAGDEGRRVDVFGAAARGGLGGAVHGFRLEPAGSDRVRLGLPPIQKLLVGSAAGGARVPAAGLLPDLQRKEFRVVDFVLVVAGPTPTDRIVSTRISIVARRRRGLLRRHLSHPSRIAIRNRRGRWRC